MGGWYYYQLNLILTSVYILNQLILGQEVYHRHDSQSHILESNDISIRYQHWNLFDTSTGMPDISNSSDDLPVYENCRAFVTEFSYRAADFVHCSVDNARPFRFCERCISHYTKAITVFDDIEKNDERLDNCKNLLLNSDRVQVINSVNKDIRKIWLNADCEKCFATYSEDSNGTVKYQLTKETEQFLVHYSNFTDCIPADVHKQVHNTTICRDCLPYYTDMNLVFKSLLNVSVFGEVQSVHHVCMDIVDMMNYSRLLWGNGLGCTVRHVDYPPVLSFALVILLIPVMFYISMAIYGTKKERKLVTHKRLTSSAQNYGSNDSTYLLSNESNSSYNSSSIEDATSISGPANHLTSSPVPHSGVTARKLATPPITEPVTA